MLKRLPFPATSLGSGPRALTGLLITRSVAANVPAGALSSDQGGFGCVPYASRLSQSGQRSSRGGAGVGRGSGGTAPLKTPPLASLARDAPVTAVSVSGEMCLALQGEAAVRVPDEGKERVTRAFRHGVLWPVWALVGQNCVPLAAAPPPHPPRARSGSSPAGFWHGVFLLRLLSYPHLTLYARLWW